LLKVKKMVRRLDFDAMINLKKEFLELSENKNFRSMHTNEELRVLFAQINEDFRVAEEQWLNGGYKSQIRRGNKVGTNSQIKRLQSEFQEYKNMVEYHNQSKSKGHQSMMNLPVPSITNARMTRQRSVMQSL
jgi:hypothetical protein